MVDITMCDGKDCPKKQDCYRYLAKKAKRMQTFFRRAPGKDGKCGHFWPVVVDGKNMKKRWDTSYI